MRVALFSSTQFGLDCLKDALTKLPEVEICGILTTPRRIEISYSENPVTICRYADFTEWGTRLGCPVVRVQQPDARSYCNHIETWNAELVLVLGWYYMVPERVRALAFKGCLGIHASLLPKYRGGAPLVWAIINGEKETGVTLFHLASGVDDGDIVMQRKFRIEPEDTCATVYVKATTASIRLLRKALPLIEEGTAPRKPQDHTHATSYPQRKPEDGFIDWSSDAKRIRDFIRAQTRPYPGAYTVISGKKITLWDADIEDLKP